MTTRSPHLQEVVQSLEAAYGDLALPDLSSQERRYRLLVTHGIVFEMMRRFFVKDETDLNDHMAVHLHLCAPRCNLMVCLSLVEPWCMVFRMQHDEEVYDSVIEDTPRSGPEAEVVLLLERHDFRIVGRQLAAMPLRMSLPNTDDDDVRIYHGIVSDDGIVPEVLRS
jgi:hypothetical protein